MYMCACIYVCGGRVKLWVLIKNCLPVFFESRSFLRTQSSQISPVWLASKPQESACLILLRLIFEATTPTFQPGCQRLNSGIQAYITNVVLTNTSPQLLTLMFALLPFCCSCYENSVRRQSLTDWSIQQHFNLESSLSRIMKISFYFILGYFCVIQATQ